jgi:hypothetical protein
MTDLLKTGMLYLATALKASASQACTYTPASGSPYSVDATLGRSDLERPDEEGGVFVSESTDFIVSLEDLAAEPVAGDRITPPDGRVFEAMAAAEGRCFSPCDSHEILIRIHTKRVS